MRVYNTSSESVSCEKGHVLWHILRHDDLLLYFDRIVLYEKQRGTLFGISCKKVLPKSRGLNRMNPHERIARIINLLNDGQQIIRRIRVLLSITIFNHSFFLARIMVWFFIDRDRLHAK